MKIAEYKQMMEYLTRPGFNGGGSVRNKTILPKKKPEEEVKKRKIKNFEKAKPALENPKEVKEMIDKPKRGLVDEPGSYSLSEKALNNIKEFEKETGLKYEELNDRSKKRVRAEGKTVGRNILVKKFEESKEGQKIIKDFEERTGKKYVDQLPGTRKSIRDKTFKFAEKVPSNDPTRFKEIKNFVNSTKKTFGYLPTSAEIRTHFLETKGVKYDKQIINYLNKTKTKLPSGKGVGPAADLDARIKKLLKSKTITNILDEGRFPTNSVIKNVLNVNPTTAGSTAFDLAKTLTGERKIRLFNAPTKYKSIAKKYVAENAGDLFKRSTRKERTYYERGLTKLLNLPKNIRQIRRDIVDKLKIIVPEMKNLSVDEIAGITSSMRTGSGPYAIFGQVLDKDFNTTKGSFIDARKGTLESKLINLAKNDPERLNLKTNYNKQVDQFELNANKNNPIKKVKGLKLSFEPPSKTVKNKKIYNQYKDLFDAHYNKYGYSFEVPADRDSIVDISKKLDNKAFQNTIKNRFTKLIGKGGKFGALVGLGTLAGTGFALANQPGVQEAQAATPKPMDFDLDMSLPPKKESSTKTLAGTIGAAITAGTKKGRDIAKKVTSGTLKGFGKAFLPLGTPTGAAAIEKAYFFDPTLESLKKGEKIKSSPLQNFLIDVSLPVSAVAPTAKAMNLFGPSKGGFFKRTAKDIAKTAFGGGYVPRGIDRLFQKIGLQSKRLGPGVVSKFIPNAFRFISPYTTYAAPVVETAIQGYNAYKDLQEARKKYGMDDTVTTALGQAPRKYVQELISKLPEVDRSGAAGGGIMKMAGKSSGPPPESGPTSQGLDFLVKRGR